MVFDFSFSSSKIDTKNFSASYVIDRKYIAVFLQENGKKVKNDEGFFKTCDVNVETFKPKSDQEKYCTAEAINVAKALVKHHDEVLEELNMTDDDIYQMLLELAEKEVKK